MKYGVFKNCLVFFFILMISIFFIYSPSNLPNNALNNTEQFSNIQDDLIINESDFIYSVNTNEIYINQTYNIPKIFLNTYNSRIFEII